MDLANRAAIRDGYFTPLEEDLGKQVVRLREIVTEFVRLNDESGLHCEDSSGLVLALNDAKATQSDAVGVTAPRTSP